MKVIMVVTELAQKTLNYYGRNVFTVQITATYSKPTMIIIF